MKGRSVLIFALLAIAAVAIAGTSHACVSPEDPYSVEVLLNKPGLSYDLSMLKSAENVVDVNPELIGVSGEVVVYKSHYHDDLAAIVYESSIETAEETNEHPVSYPHAEPISIISTKKQTKISGEEEIIKDNGEQSQEQAKEGKEESVQKHLSVRLTPKVHEVTEYRYKTKAQISKTEFEPHQNFSHLTTPEELQIPGWTIKQSGVTCVADECFYSYSAEYKENDNWIKISFFPPERTRGGIEIDIETNKELNEELKNEILNVISSMFYLGKPDFQKITDALQEMEKVEMKVPELVFNFTDEEAKKALKTELEWLSNTGIVKGLTDEDIREIENTTKVGYAGYNSRIFYEDGKWIPYSESENPQMVRVKALCSFSLKCIQIPTEDVVITEANTNISSSDMILVVLGIVIAILAAIGVVVIWVMRRW
ncbi:MAG TPA: hypothetical protein C5S37_01430 [Methanophagales archaeon]|nr:hypothetical protein [Methanophagales archaeon]